VRSYRAVATILVRHHRARLRRALLHPAHPYAMLRTSTYPFIMAVCLMLRFRMTAFTRLIFMDVFLAIRPKWT